MANHDQGIPMRQATDLPAQLRALLAAQIAHVRQGRMAQVEQLSVQADAIIAQMAAGHADQPLMIESQKAQLERLYAELVLMLRTQRADVQTKLMRLRKVKRVVGTYNRKTGQ